MAEPVEERVGDGRKENGEEGEDEEKKRERRGRGEEIMGRASRARGPANAQSFVFFPSLGPFEMSIS